MISLDCVATIINSTGAVKEFQELYGYEPESILNQQARYKNLAGLFADYYPHHDSASFFSTPGRTEIGGNHTDHQNGRVLCAAVNLDILAIAAPNKENIIRLKSEGFSYVDEIELENLDPSEQEAGKSASLIRGVAAGFARQGYNIGGLDIYTTSLVPKGSGLSSSAAFEVLVATVINTFYNNNRMSAVEMALISQYAENAYFGKPSGLMDQCGCSVGGFITIDFAKPGSPEVVPIPINFDESGHGLVITYTGSSHADLTSDYSSITADMSEVAGKFGKEILRDVDEADFWLALPELRKMLDDKVLLRAIHFFTENSRVVEQVNSLNIHDFNRFLTLVNQSGNSSWTLLQNIWSIRSPLEQPLGLALALSSKLLGGHGASRVHGGGFAGTIQAFVPLEMMEEYISKMGLVFGNESIIQLQIRNRSTCEVSLA